MRTTTFQITGMTCSHCENAVREEVGALAGVGEIDISASTGLLVLTSPDEIDEAAVVAAVDEAGYVAVRRP